MIRVIDGLPDNVVGIVAKGRVTIEDCDRVLKPVMQTSLKHDKMRSNILKISELGLPQWERVAVVTDVGWVRHTVKALRFLIGSDIRVYTTSQAGDGLAWIRSH